MKMMTRKQKEAKVAELKTLISENNAVCLLNMHKMPARQMFQIKRKLEGKAVVKMAKKTLLKLAFAGSEAESLLEKESQEPAIMFTNDNPFKLYKFLKNNKSPASAKVGDKPTDDIIVRAGATELEPGPAIAQLQGAGLKTTIEGGKIHVSADKTVLEAGGEVTPELADLFSALKMEPMLIGVDLVAAFEDGVMYERDVLDIDEEEFMDNVMNSITSAVNLSVNTGYLTPLTAPIAIVQAHAEAKALALEAGVVDKSIIGELLAKAMAEASALEEKVGTMSDVKKEKPAEESKNEKDGSKGKDDKKEDAENSGDVEKDGEKDGKAEETKKDAKPTDDKKNDASNEENKEELK